ncbi:MAG: trypsin-like peptidase domain-containing protein [Rhodospirillales bacterium]|nr:trypsin-like peptidase domain-containing protein [Rhodospirillales bacterium]
MSIAVAAGLICISPVVADEAGDVAYPADYYGRVDLPLPQAFSHLKRLIGETENFEPIKDFSEDNRYRVMASPIGRLDLLVRTDGKESVSLCTGWVISEQYIMTNHHCIPGKSAQVLKASLLMNYLYEGNAKAAERFEVETVPIETSVELDYSIVSVNGNPGAKYGVIPILARDPKPAEELFVIQHPAGTPKRLTRRNCRADVDTERPDELRHFCDTLGGSSGSPVFSDNDMTLVGLHFAGIEKKVNFAKRMTVLIQKSPILAQLSSVGQGNTREASPEVAPTHQTTQHPAAQAGPTNESAPQSSGWQPIN